MVDLVGAGAEDRLFFGNHGEKYFAVMKDGFKYTWAREGGGELLFNMKADPMEQHDLMQTMPGLAAELRGILYDKVQEYTPELIVNGELTVLPPIKSPRDVPKWPGFHSTKVPSDVLH